MLKITFLIPFSLFALMFFLPLSAIACSCGHTSFEDSFKRANTIVTVSIIEHLENDKVKVRFDDVWKGTAPKQAEAVIRSGLSAACASVRSEQPPIGSRYLFYTGSIAAEETATFYIGGCGRNGSYESRETDILQLKAYRNDYNAMIEEFEKNSEEEAAWSKKAAFFKEHHERDKEKELLLDMTERFPPSVTVLMRLADITLAEADMIRPYEKSADYEEMIKLKKDYYKQAKDYADAVLSLQADHETARNISNKAHLFLSDGEEIILKNATYEKIVLEDKLFENETVTDLSLLNSRLKNISFLNTSLSDTSFVGSSLNNVSFKKSHIDNVLFNLRGFSFRRKDKNQDISELKNGFYDSTLKNVTFNGTDFIIEIADSQIENADFSNANISLPYGGEPFVIIKNSHFKNTNFNNAHFWNKTFEYAVIQDAVFTNSNFNNASMSVHFVNSDFSSSNLAGIDLTGSMFDCNTKWPEGFDPMKAGAVPEHRVCSDKTYPAPNFERKNFGKSRRFSAMNYADANFRRAILERASFVGTNLDFVGTNLEGADFTDANIRDADMRNANLKNANLSNTLVSIEKLEGANIEGAVLAGAQLSGSHFVDDHELHKANLTLARGMKEFFEKLNPKLDMKKHQLVYWGSPRTQKDTNPCLEIDSSYINIKDKDYSGINLSYSCLKGATFKNVNLNKATLYDAILTDANLDGTSLTGAKYSCDTALPKQYEHLYERMILISDWECRNEHPMPVSNLKNADMSNMFLYNAYLVNANLEGANFSYADLRRADLTGAKINDDTNFNFAEYDHGTKWPEGFDFIKAGAIKYDTEKNVSNSISVY